LLNRAEQEVRSSDQPRFNMEMALLRLMHMRKLVPLTELLQGARGVQAAQGARGAQGTVGAQGVQGAQGARGARGAQGAQGLRAPAARTGPATSGRMTSRPPAGAARAAGVPPSAVAAVEPGRSYKDALLSAIKTSKPTFY